MYRYADFRYYYMHRNKTREKDKEIKWIGIIWKCNII